MRANRLSNALRGLGVGSGDRVAIVLPQRPETAISYMAIFQMGAIAVPLSHLFGPDALEYRLRDAGVVAPSSIRTRCPSSGPCAPGCRSCITSSAPRAHAKPTCWTGTICWRDPVTRFDPVDTAADDPALIIYTSGTTGSPKGALIPHRALLGNLPGFICSHDFFPQEGDMFWSPADWAWTGGLFDALLPTWHFGFPILAFRGRFEPERAFWLLEKYGVRNAFLFPTALKMMMKEVPTSSRARFDVRLRSLMSGGEAVGDAVERMGARPARRDGQRDFRSDRDELRDRRLCGACIAPKARRHGARVPGPSHLRCWMRTAPKSRPATSERSLFGETGDPVVFLEYWNNPEATQAKFTGGLGPHRRPGHPRRRGLLLVQGPHRRCHQERRLPHRPGRDRGLSAQASGRRQCCRHRPSR